MVSVIMPSGSLPPATADQASTGHQVWLGQNQICCFVQRMGPQEWFVGLRFGVAVVNKDALAAGPLASGHIAPAIPDYKTGAQIQMCCLRRRQQQARGGLPALAAIRVIMITHSNI